MMKRNLKAMTFIVVSLIVFTACATPAPQISAAVGAEVEVEHEEQWVSFQWASDFPSFSGIVIDIQPYGHTDGKFFVLVEDEHMDLYPKVSFLVDHESVVLVEKFEIGAEVTVIYDINLSTMAVTDGQLNARALALGNAGLVVDRFNKSDIFEWPDTRGGFLGNESNLFIHINDETEIVFQDGTPFEGELVELENRIFALTAEYVMWSYPGQAVPPKVVVMFESAEHPLLQLTPEDLDIMWDNMFDPETVQIIVNGEVVPMPTPFINREAGFVMVPIAYIAEALGYETYVIGDGELMIGRSIITVGVDDYHYNRMAAVQLGAAPELHDDVFFVPLHFFGHVFPGAGYTMDGNIFVSSTEMLFGDDIDWSLYPIIINNAVGVEADLYTMEGSDFPTHVPLFPVAFALGVDEIETQDTDPPVIELDGLKGGISFVVGSEEFSVGGETVTLLDLHASMAIRGEIYVPISFFRDVFGMGSALWMSGHVHIDAFAAEDMY